MNESFYNPYQGYYSPFQRQQYQPPMQNMQQPQTNPMPQTQPIQPQTMAQGISPASRPVGNRDEANAVPADFNGALMVFPDMAHGCVYIKRWNSQSGSADFLEFALIQPTQNVPQTVQNAPKGYLTNEDLRPLQHQIERLQAEIDTLKNPISTLPKTEVIRNDEQSNAGISADV